MIKKFIPSLVILLSLFFGYSKEVYISAEGSDNNKGTKDNPVLTLQKGLQIVQPLLGKEPVNIWIEEGDYHIGETIILNEQFSGTKDYPVVISSLPGHKVRIKGSVQVHKVIWKPYKFPVLACIGGEKFLE